MEPDRCSLNEKVNYIKSKSAVYIGLHKPDNMVNVTLFSRTVYVFRVLWCILGTLDESFLPFQRGEASIYKAADDAFIDVISALCYHFLVLRGKSFPRDCIVSIKNNDQFV